MFEIIEEVRRTASQIFRKTPMATRPSRPSERRVKRGGSFVDPQGRNIPDPWSRREGGKTRQIANLPSVVSNILMSGPTKTMYGSGLITINPQALTRRPRQFRSLSEIASQVTDFNESEVIAMDPRSRGTGGRPRPLRLTREERLARVGRSEMHSVALDSAHRLPPGQTEILRGQGGAKGPITWAILFELLSKFLGEEGVKARMRQMGFGV